jgi:hypothetical protein
MLKALDPVAYAFNRIRAELGSLVIQPVVQTVTGEVHDRFALDVLRWEVAPQDDDCLHPADSGVALKLVAKLNGAPLDAFPDRVGSPRVAIVVTLAIERMPWSTHALPVRFLVSST